MLRQREGNREGRTVGGWEGGRERGRGGYEEREEGKEGGAVSVHSQVLGGQSDVAVHGRDLL